MPKGKKISKKMVIAIAIVGVVILIGSSFGIYLYLHDISHRSSYYGSRGNFRGNFTFNNETLSQTSEFFNNNSDIQTLQSYCQGNMIYCRYYCTRTDPQNSLCNQLQFPTRPMNGSFGPMMNYSPNGGQQ
ncbi:MAG: hypothetical protein WAU65_00690 [Candidatus Nanoarchaeia archaeon]